MMRHKLCVMHQVKNLCRKEQGFRERTGSCGCRRHQFPDAPIK
jgi:hypothetical protein